MSIWCGFPPKFANYRTLPLLPQLEDRITAVDLAEMAGALEAAAGLLPPSERRAANRLRNQATVLGAQQEVVDQMAEIVVTLRVRRLSGVEDGKGVGR